MGLNLSTITERQISNLQREESKVSFGKYLTRKLVNARCTALDLGLSSHDKEH